MKSIATTILCLSAPLTTLGFAFVPSSASRSSISIKNAQSPRNTHRNHKSASSSLSMVDSNILMGGGIAIAGLAAGIGLVAFAEGMGERSKARGGGLSDGMATKLVGGLLEDVEVDTVSDLSSLTEKLEAALKESGGADAKELEMKEEDKRRIAEEADDGW
ncbi:hypothetical protein ACHAXH_002371 [Discostella pseudostelligera]